MEIIESLCKRPKMWAPEVTTAQDLLAAIRGICLGLDDPEGKCCLGTFPRFIQSRFPEHDKGSWSFILEGLFANQALHEACDAMKVLVNEWKETNPAMPGEIVPVTWTREEAITRSTFRLMEDVLRNPQAYIPDASAFGEILAFLWGVLVSHCPPHGSINGIVSLNAYVVQFFGKGSGRGMGAVLLHELRDYPFRDSCTIYADLITRWLDQVVRAEEA